MTGFHRTICVAVALSGMVCGSSLLAADGERDVAVQINQANGLLRSGDVDGAVKAYKQVQDRADGRADLSYNMAVAQYRKGDMAAAERLFKDASNGENDTLAAKARYNLGNCSYASALRQAETDHTMAIKGLDKAIANYRSALEIDPNDADSRANIELASALIDKLRDQDKKQQQQQSQNQQQDKQKQNQQQKDQQQGGEQKDQKQEKSSQQDKKQQKDSQQQQGKDQQQPKQDQQQQKSESSQNNESKGEQGSQDKQQKAGEDSKNQSRDKTKPQSQGQKSQSQDSKPDQENSKSQQQDGKPKSQEQKDKDVADQKQQSQGQPQPQPSPDKRQASSADEKQQEKSQERQSYSSSQQKTAGQRPEQDKSQQMEQPKDQQGSAAPKGTLSAADKKAGKTDEQDKELAGKPELMPDGAMTTQEAEKMLQVIRDQEMIRRLRRQAAERNQHIPVDRDW